MHLHLGKITFSQAHRATTSIHSRRSNRITRIRHVFELPDSDVEEEYEREDSDDLEETDDYNHEIDSCDSDDTDISHDSSQPTNVRERNLEQMKSIVKHIETYLPLNIIEESSKEDFEKYSKRLKVGKNFWSQEGHISIE